MKPKPSRGVVRFQFDDMRYLNEESRVRASNEKQRVLASLSTMLRNRFDDFNNDLYQTMSFFDPKHWKDEKDYGNDAIVKFATHFQSTLEIAGYDSTQVLKEWRMLRNYAKVWLKNVSPEEVWKKIISFKKSEFPNVCLLVEILITISGSN